MIEIASTAKISKLADIEDSVRGTRIIIEDGVVIDSFVKIKPVGGTGDVKIGAHSYVNAGYVIYSGNGVQIGRHVLGIPGIVAASSEADDLSVSDR